MNRETKVTNFIGLLAAIVAPLLQLSIKSINPIAAAAYFLTLTVLGISLWIVFRNSNREFGWWFGRLSDHALALLYPIIAMSVLLTIAIAHGKILSFDAIEYEVLLKYTAIMALGTLVAVLITEEGFFRGALWGVAERANWGRAS